MFTRRILALAAVLFAALTIGGSSIASAATVAPSAYHQTVGAARTQSSAISCGHGLWCR
jgi:hypothetical protein